MDLSRYAHDNNTAELLDSKNYKQVVKNIDKKLKKTPTDAYLKALKARIVFQLGDVDDSYNYLDNILKNIPAVSDKDTRELLYDLGCELSALDYTVNSTLLENLWQNAVKGKKSDADKITCAQQWAQWSVRHRQFQHLMRAANLVQRLYPPGDERGRAYYFWQAHANWMTYQYPPWQKDQKRSEVVMQLALKMMDKAAEQTPEDPTGQPGTGTCIKQRTELELYVSMLRMVGNQVHLAISEGRNARAARLLSEARFSKITTGSYPLTRAEIAVVTFMLDWKRLWELAKRHLEEAVQRGEGYPLDDLYIWKKLVLSAEELEDDVVRQETKRLLESAIAIDGRLLAPRRAMMRLYQNIPEVRPEVTTSQIFVDIEDDTAPYRQVAEFLLENQHRDAIIDKFGKHYEGLPVKAARRLRDELQTNAGNYKSARKSEALEDSLDWVRAQVNAFSFRWLVLEDIRDPEYFSKLNDEKKHKVYDEYEQFAFDCTKFYSENYQTYGKELDGQIAPYDKAGILAVKAMHCMYALAGHQSYLILAVVWIEHIAKVSKQNFNARLLQINLLRNLSVPTYVWERYKALDVKEILCESLCPLMFKNISWIHPLSSGTFDPYSEMANPLMFYEKALGKIPQFEEVALKWENYESAHTFEELRAELIRSKTRRLLILERRRIARLTGKAYKDADLTFESPQNRHALDDNAPAGAVNTTIEGCGDILPHQWINYLVELDRCFDVACSGKPRSPSEIYALKRQDHFAFRQDMLSDFERSILHFARHARELAIDLYDENIGIAELEARLGNSVDAVNAIVANKILEEAYAGSENDPIPSVKVVKHVFSELEALQVCFQVASRALAYLKERSKHNTKRTPGSSTLKSTQCAKVLQSIPTERAKKLKDTAAHWVDYIRGQLQSERISNSLLISHHPQDRGGVGNTLRAMVTDASSVAMVKELARSGIEPLRQVGRIKVGSEAVVDE